MSTRVYPPVHAHQIRSESATIPAYADFHAGKEIRWVLWSGYASHGYQTNYQRIPKVWFEITIVGGRPNGRDLRHCFAYSGKRIDKAERDLLKNLADFAAKFPGAEATFPTGRDPDPEAGAYPALYATSND